MIPAVGKVNVNHSFHAYPPCEVKFDWMRIRAKICQNGIRFFFHNGGCFSWVDLQKLGSQGSVCKNSSTCRRPKPTSIASHSQPHLGHRPSPCRPCNWRMFNVHAQCAPQKVWENITDHHELVRSALPRRSGSCSWFAGLTYPEPIWKIVIRSGCTCFHTVFSMVMVFDVCLIWQFHKWSMDSGQDACILFKVRRLGRISCHASSREAFDRWIFVGSNLKIP